MWFPNSSSRVCWREFWGIQALASMNEKTYGAKTSRDPYEICSYCTGHWPHEWGYLLNSSVNCNPVALHLLLIASAFLPWSFEVPQYVSALLVWVGWNWSRTFVQCPEMLEKLITFSSLPFLARETLSSWEGSSWCWTILVWGMECCRQNKVVSLLFLCDFSQVFFVCLLVSLCC